MNVIADLFSLVAEDLVFSFFDIGFHEVGQESVELYSGMVGTGEAAASKAAGGHAEVAAVFLDHDVAGDFGGSEEGVFTLVNGEAFGDAVLVS